MVEIILTKEETDKIIEIAEKMSIAKLTEYDYKRDNKGIKGRFEIGISGEYAVCLMLHIPYDLDNFVIDDSSKFNVPDLLPYYNIGVKTFKYQYPIIYKKNTYPQIIVKYTKNSDGIVKLKILGLASVKSLNEDQDITKASPAVRRKGYKTCYTGHKLGHLLQLERVKLDEFRFR